VAEAATTRGRLAAIGALLALPLLGLALLLAIPGYDVMWEHHPSHFWLVLGVAVVNVVLALLTGEAASQRNDARLFLVSLCMLSSAGFLALHALATPQVLLAKPNEGFVIATPVGLVVAAFFAAASAMVRGGGTGMRVGMQRWLRGALLAAIAGWAIASLAQVEFLSRTPGEEAPPVLRLLSPLAIVLYGFAAVRYVGLYEGRHRTLPLAIAVAFVLLAEAMLAIVFGRSWHATWWEWHVLMAVAFGTILLAARAEYRRERSVTGAFGGVYLERTLERIDRRHSAALRALTTAIRDEASLAPVVDDLRSQGFTADEVEVMERSAHELSRVDALLRRYVGPPLAERLEEEPGLARLGGRESEVTVLFADLAGFTTFCDGREPGEVIDMVNAYWERAVPRVAEQGGLIERFAGDAILVLFNALEDQPDHALRAARASIAMRDATEQVAAAHTGWPRFRFGLNTGPAAVGNVGAGTQRSFAALGNTTNIAARLQAAASTGQVLATAATVEALAGAISARPLGPLSIRGTSGPVETFELL
jgi:class 3 adenylate cyclase